MSKHINPQCCLDPRILDRIAQNERFGQSGFDSRIRDLIALQAFSAGAWCIRATAGRFFLQVAVMHQLVLDFHETGAAKATADDLPAN
jgi:hypothetical protein